MDGKQKHWFSLRVLAVTGIAVLVATGAVVWCAKSRIPNIDATTAKQLHTAADQLSEHSDGAVDKATWPVAISKFSPKSVRVTTNGIYVKVRSSFVEEQGLFLLPTNSSFQPTVSG